MDKYLKAIQMIGWRLLIIFESRETNESLNLCFASVRRPWINSNMFRDIVFTGNFRCGYCLDRSKFNGLFYCTYLVFMSRTTKYLYRTIQNSAAIFDTRHNIERIPYELSGKIVLIGFCRPMCCSKSLLFFRWFQMIFSPWLVSNQRKKQRFYDFEQHIERQNRCTIQNWVVNYSTGWNSNGNRSERKSIVGSTAGNFRWQFVPFYTRRKNVRIAYILSELISSNQLRVPRCD